MSLNSIEQLQVNAQNSADATMEHIYKLSIKRLLKNSYSCVRDCVSNPDTSRLKDEECSKRCLANLDYANSFVSRTMADYTNSLMTCNKKCMDDVRFSNPAGEVDDANLGKCENCIANCVKDFISKRSAVIGQIEMELQKNAHK